MRYTWLTEKAHTKGSPNYLAFKSYADIYLILH